jgi:glycosyltransferase involved in cell wall biosynthesis
MVKRKRLLITFSYDELWIGGTYYLLNLIQALNLLPDVKKPVIIINISTEKDKKIIRSINYPYLKFRDLYLGFRIYKRLINKTFRIFFKKEIFRRQRTYSNFDFIFITYYDLIKTIENGVPKKKILCWIPDLQDLFFPQFFDKWELEFREKQYQKAINENIHLIFSSNVSKGDFINHLGNCKNKIYVVPFAVFHPNYEILDEGQLFTKYSINKKYFIVCNQFWQHKNHEIIIKSIFQLKSFLINHPIQFVFTGKEHDNRASDFFEALQRQIKDYNIEEYTLFLGLIPRNEQLKLMKSAMAVIQPSLFEGWSTVVEDAKAMNKFIVLSNINVHKEQINENCMFFNPHSSEELVSCLQNIVQKNIKVKEVDYNINKLQFALDFYNIIK